MASAASGLNALQSTCIVSGVLLSLAGIFAATFGHDAAQTFVDQQLKAAFIISSPSAAQYAPWVDSTNVLSGAVLSSYYVVNITNPEEVLAGGKPNVVELGPLRYHYTNKKYNVTWDEQGEVVEYKPYQYYSAADDATVALEQQVVTTIDLVLQAALRTAGDADFVPVLYPSTLEPGALFTQKTVREMLWGYVDPLFKQPFPGLQSNDTSLEYALGQHSSTRMRTGKTTGSEAYQLQTWDGGQVLTCCDKGPAGEANAGSNCAKAWPGFDSATVTGSSGMAFHMGVDPTETLQLATYDFGMYRHWPFTCEGGSDGGNAPGPGPQFYDGGSLTGNVGSCDSYNVDGLDLLRFRMASWALSNMSQSETLGVTEGADYGITGPTGAYNQGACEQHAPIYISRPHFLGGSDSIINGITGYGPGYPYPSQDLHGSYFGVEPITGLVMDLHVRVGINAKVTPVTVHPLGGNTTYFPYLPSEGLFIPLAWGGQDAVPSAYQTQEFKGSVYKGVTLLVAVRWGSVAIALLGAVLAGGCLSCARAGYKPTCSSVACCGRGSAKPKRYSYSSRHSSRGEAWPEVEEGRGDPYAFLSDSSLKAGNRGAAPAAGGAGRGVRASAPPLPQARSKKGGRGDLGESLLSY